MRVVCALLLAGLMSGIASGLILFDGIGVFVVLPVALALSILLGLPGYLALRKLGWLAWWQLALTGVLISAPVALVFPLSTRLVISILASGALGGILFWWAGVGPNYSIKRNINRSD
jgi:hypothetical protein